MARTRRRLTIDALWPLTDRCLPAALCEAGGAALVRARALVLLCAIIIVASVPAFLARLGAGASALEVALFAAAMLVTTGVLVALRRGVSVRAMSFATLSLGVVLAVSGAVAVEGIFSVTLLWIVLLPPVGAFFLGPGTTIWAGVVAALLVAGVAALHLAGVCPPAPLGVLAHRVVNLAALSAVAAGIVRLYAWSEDRAREAEREALRMVEAVSTNIGAGAVLVEAGRVRYANAAAAAILGCEADALVGADAEAVLPPSVALRPGTAVELDLPRAQGLARVEARVDAVGSEGGAALVTLVDLTDRWRAEQERLRMQARLQETERLDSVGRIATGVAHDFNNLLVGILGNVELLSESATLGADERAAVREIRGASERAASLVAQLLAYAGRGHAVLRRVDVGAVLREAVRLAEAARHAPGIVAVEQGEGAGAWADATLLSQVCTNLLTNALDALPPERAGAGAVRVRVTAGEVDAAELAGDRLPPPSPRPGRYVRIEVSDDGTGIAEDRQKRLFEPFYSAKPAGRGLGLAAVQGIVRRLGGALLLRSEPDRGSTFTVLIPAAPEGEALEVEPAARRGVPRAPLRVLVVDDDPLVRAQIARVLRRGGMTVVEAEGGLEAIAVVAEAREPFACGVLDYFMPDLDGVETARRMRRIDPTLPLVLCSGTVGSADVGVVGFAAVISKPFAPAELVKAVERAARVPPTSAPPAAATS